MPCRVDKADVETSGKDRLRGKVCQIDSSRTGRRLDKRRCRHCRSFLQAQLALAIRSAVTIPRLVGHGSIMQPQHITCAKIFQPSLQPGRWYLFGLSALTIFLLTIFLFGSWAGEHLFVAEVHLRTDLSMEPQAEKLSTDQVVRDITNPKHLQQALIRTGYFAGTASTGDQRAEAATKLLERLQIPSVEQDRRGLRVKVAYTHRSETFAASVANQVAHDFAERYRERSERALLATLTRAREITQQARNRVTECEAVVEQLLDRIFPRGPMSPANNIGDGRSDTQSPLAVVLASAEIGASDPEAMERQLAELEHERRLLLKTRTDQHPAVVALDKQIAGLRERLESAVSPTATVAPRSISDEGSLPVVPTPPPLPDEIQQLLTEHQQVAQTFHDCRRRLERLLADLQVAERGERVAWQKHQEAMNTTLAEAAALGGRTTIHPAKWRRTTIWAMVGALVLGGAVVWVSTLAWQTCIHPQQLQQDSGIPLIAMVRSGRRTTWSGRWWVRQGIGGWKIFCEASLVCGVGWVLLMSVCETGFAAEFWRDPLGQIAFAASRTSEFFRT